MDVPPIRMNSEHPVSKMTFPRQNISTTQFCLCSSCVRLLTKSIDRQFHRQGGLLVCLILFISNVFLVQGISSTCRSGATGKGSTTTLTCTFGEDLSKVQTNVYVDHLQRNSSKHVLVTFCQWTSNAHNCKSMSGYHLIGNITNTLSVEIPNIQEKHTGTYWCEIYGSHPSERTTCEISFKEASVVAPLNTTNPTLSSPAKGIENESKGETDERFKALLIAFCVLVLVMIIAIISLVLVVLHFKRKYCCKESHSSNASPNNNTNESCQTSLIHK